jgi:hypothetical protein
VGCLQNKFTNLEFTYGHHGRTSVQSFRFHTRFQLCNLKILFIDYFEIYSTTSHQLLRKILLNCSYLIGCMDHGFSQLVQSSDISMSDISEQISQTTQPFKKLWLLCLPHALTSKKAAFCAQNLALFMGSLRFSE